MSNQPDYNFLLKLDKWTKKDAALILCGLDPSHYKSVRFSQNDLPSELISAQQLYRIFCSVNFHTKYRRDHHPLDYLLECRQKGITLPEPLMASALQLFSTLRKFDEVTAELNDSVESRERNYLLKIIGALASVYCHEKIKPSRTKWTKVSVAAVVEDILQYADDHELASSGLGKSNLHKKISEGIAAFDDDFQTRAVQLLS